MPAVAAIDTARAPAFELRVLGRPLPQPFAASIGALTVDDDVRWPTMFVFDVCASDAHPEVARWRDDPRLFAVGTTVEVALRGPGGLATLMDGEIAALVAEFDQQGLPRLTVRGFDRRFRLQRGRRTRSFVDIKDSDVVRRIAGAANLRLRIADSGDPLPFLMQADRSDWDFLCERAAALNWEILMRDGELVFGPRAPEASPVRTLALGDTLREYRASFAPLPLPTQVTARGWGLDSGQPVRASAAPRPPAAATLDDHFVLPPGRADAVRSEGQRRADARLEQARLAQLHGQATCAGDPALRAGSTVELQGLGRRFGGLHYIVAARHRHDETGYTTTLQLRRSPP